MTVPVHKKGAGLQRIDRVRLYADTRWRRKHEAALKSAYARSPWFADHSDFLSGLFDGRHERLIDFNMAVISHLATHLGISTPIVLQSTLGTRQTGDRLLVELCRKTGADTFLAQQAACRYIGPDLFDRAGLQVLYFQPRGMVYPQLWGRFIGNLSALDLLFNCGPRAAAYLGPGEAGSKAPTSERA
jgi:hypothetical protein